MIWLGEQLEVNHKRLQTKIQTSQRQTPVALHSPNWEKFKSSKDPLEMNYDCLHVHIRRTFRTFWFVEKWKFKRDSPKHNSTGVIKCFNFSFHPNTFNCFTSVSQIALKMSSILIGTMHKFSCIINNTNEFPLNCGRNHWFFMSQTTCNLQSMHISMRILIDSFFSWIIN